MDREGHVGAGLLAAAPVGVALAVDGRSSAAVVAVVGMALLSQVPDWDRWLPFVSHRGATHTLAFAALVGGAAWAGTLVVARALSLPAAGDLPAYGLLVGVLAVVVHLAVDALDRDGVRPLWPVWTGTVSLDVTRSGSPVANRLLLTLGLLVSGAVVLVLVD